MATLDDPARKPASAMHALKCSLSARIRSGGRAKVNGLNRLLRKASLETGAHIPEWDGTLHHAHEIYQLMSGGETAFARKRKRSRTVTLQRKTYGEYLNYLDSPEWNAFRTMIFAQRGRTCEKCGTNDGAERHVHHLTYKNLMREKPSDVLVLCEPCHSAIHAKKIRARASKAGRASAAAKRARKDAA